jgi:hypothetical protein
MTGWKRCGSTLLQPNPEKSVVIKWVCMLFVIGAGGGGPQFLAIRGRWPKIWPHRPMVPPCCTEIHRDAMRRDPPNWQSSSRAPSVIGDGLRLATCFIFYYKGLRYGWKCVSERPACCCGTSFHLWSRMPLTVGHLKLSRYPIFAIFFRKY